MHCTSYLGMCCFATRLLLLLYIYFIWQWNKKSISVVPTVGSGGNVWKLSLLSVCIVHASVYWWHWTIETAWRKQDGLPLVTLLKGGAGGGRKHNHGSPCALLPSRSGRGLVEGGGCLSTKLAFTFPVLQVASRWGEVAKVALPGPALSSVI